MAKYMYGKVVSHNSDKTACMLIEMHYVHSVYKKKMKKTKKLMIHDPMNECKNGDNIKVKSCAPVSKNKSWCLVEVVS